MSWEWAIDPKPSKAERRALKSLREKHPHILAGAERVAHQMAAGCSGRTKTRIHYEQRQDGWVAFIEAYSRFLDQLARPLSLPVIPAEFNDHPDKQVSPGMQPHLFADMEDCRREAEKAEEVMLAEMREIEQTLRRGNNE